MLDTLLFSASRPRPDPARALLAAALHGCILFAAIRATATLQPVLEPRPVELVPFVVPRVIRDPALPALPRAAEASAVPFEVRQFLSPPVTTPLSIPPVSLERSFDPALLRSLAGTGFGGPGGGDSTARERVLVESEVEQPAAVLRQPSPRYPPVLLHAGIAGKVQLEFIIDTTGHVESASLRVVESSQPGFEAAALESISHSLFRPALVRGRPVRQRTLQTVVFRIAP